ncbi:MAG: hypothetical protein WCA49_09020 [Candidatus Sulfotelmatobacter sp.]
MPDTFLESHRVGPLQFTISSPLSPISIRDQMVRAKMFVDRAIEANILGPARLLFVLGAGAGGVSAALYAVTRGIETTLIELRSHAFGLQRKCLSRWINPTQYDWPASHWNLQRFPWTPPAMPLPWQSQRANLVAAVWDHELLKARKNNPHLHVKFSTQIVSRTLGPQQDLEVKYQEKWDSPPPLPQPKTEYFGAALYARGHGSEASDCSVDYKGFDFWETENFELPNLGLPASPSLRHVLICGGGDGALQDFLRITTGQRSAANIVQQLSLPGDLLAETYRDEDQAHRASLWNNKIQNHWVFERRDMAQRRLVSGLLASPRGALIAQQVQTLLNHSSSLDVTLVHPCSHFSQSYPLNRFLVRLIEQCAVFLPIQILPNTVLHKVQGVLPHVCARNPVGCHGQDHEVDFGAGPTCLESSAKTVHGGYFHVIVVRVGVVPPPPFDVLTNPLFSRHSLPFHPAS